MNPIPLHQLPQKAFLRVLRSMEICDQLAYSLCSKNTKKVIKSLKLTTEKINLTVSNDIRVNFRFKKSIVLWSSMEYDEHFPNETFRLTGRIQVLVTKSSDEVTKWKLESPDFGIKEWLHHFSEVLHHPRIDDLSFDGDVIKDDFIKPVQKMIEGLHIASLDLGEGPTPEFTRKALQTFHYNETLYIDQVPFESHKMDKILVQNLRSMGISSAEVLGIDQVLLANCQKLQLSRSTFTDKDFKMFLKMWIRGSNPRLEYFYTRNWTQQTPPFDGEAIFKEINHTKIPMDSQEMYRMQVDNGHYNERKLAGGYRIWRYDGTPAVVLKGRFGFEFIVDC